MSKRTFWVTTTRTIVAIDHRAVTAESEEQAREIGRQQFAFVPEHCAVVEETTEAHEPSDRELWDEVRECEGAGYHGDDVNGINEAEFSEERA